MRGLRVGLVLMGDTRVPWVFSPFLSLLSHGLPLCPPTSVHHRYVFWFGTEMFLKGSYIEDLVLDWWVVLLGGVETCRGGV